MPRSDKQDSAPAENTKAAATATADTPAQDPEDSKDATKKGGSAAPRPRKWDYGIHNDAQIVRAAEDPTVKKDTEKEWGYTEGNPTCEKFFAKGGTRHGLRVMSRRKLITIVREGVTYPIEYVKPVVVPKEPSEPGDAKPEDNAVAPAEE